MTRCFILALIVATAGQTALSSAQKPGGRTPASNAEPEMVEIDGAKNPELIPEYLVWATGFQTLALMKEHNIRAGEKFLTRLTLSDPDAALVFGEADRHMARSNRCHEKGAAIFSDMSAQKRKIGEIEAAMQANTLECRWALLMAKDRLLESMSPEGRDLLVRWMLDERVKLKSFVVKSDLEFFRQPR